MKVNTRLGEFELETYEENNVDIVTHTSLALVLNDLRAEGKVEDVFVPLTEQVIDTVNGVYLAEVRLKDTSTGVVFRGIGEVNPLNIDSDIAKANPIIMAFNRAEDKAFISLLGIEKRGTANKFYSSIEMPSKNEPQNRQQKAKQAPTPPAVPTTLVVPATSSYDLGNAKATTKKQDVKPQEKVPEQKVETPVQNLQVEDSPFMEQDPVINPVNTKASSIDAGPLEKVSPKQNEKPIEKPAEAPAEKPVIQETPVEPTPAPAPAAPETPKASDVAETSDAEAINPGDFIIPTGRIAGKKLSEADDNFLTWFGDVTKYGAIPPRYTKEFVDAYNAFMASRN